MSAVLKGRLQGWVLKRSSVLAGLLSSASLLPGGAAPPPTAPTNLAPPSISGTAAQGNTLTVVPGSWSGNPIPSIARLWKRDGVSTGQTGLTYGLTLADVGAAITVTETATNSQGSANATSSGVGPVAGDSITPILSNLSSGWTAGQNPPDWDTQLPNYVIYDSGAGTGSEVRAVWRFNGGAWNTEDWQGVDTEVYTEHFIWSLLNAANLAAGGSFEVYVEHVIDRGLPSQSGPFASNHWTDTLNSLGVGSVQRGIISSEVGFGVGPVNLGTIAISGNSKIVLSLRFIPNGAQSVSGISANSGTVVFTRDAGSPATAKAQLWYADVGNITSLTNLTVTLSGSTQVMTTAIEELFNAAAGGPASTFYRNEVFMSGSGPFNVDGGVACPANGISLFFCTANAALGFTGATRDAVQSTADSTGQKGAIAHAFATGTVTVSGASNTAMTTVTSAWNHA